MKKIYLIASLLIGILFVSCEKEENSAEKFFNKNSIISFKQTNIKVDENSKVLNVVVSFSALKGKKASADIEVEYDGIKTKAVEGKDFKFLGDKKVEFDGTNLTDTVKIEIVDNSELTGNFQFGLKLVNVKGANIIGIDGGVKTTITIVDDEHPLAIVLGKYKQVDSSSQADGSTKDEKPYNVVIERIDGNIEEVQITNVWDGGRTIIAKVDIDNNTISILPGQVVFKHSSYGTFRAVAVAGGKLAPTEPIIGTFDDKGNITLGFWVVNLAEADAVSADKAGNYGVYPKSVLTKQ